MPRCLSSHRLRIHTTIITTTTSLNKKRICFHPALYVLVFNPNPKAGKKQRLTGLPLPFQRGCPTKLSWLTAEPQHVSVLHRVFLVLLQSFRCFYHHTLIMLFLLLKISFPPSHTNPTHCSKSHPKHSNEPFWNATVPVYPFCFLWNEIKLTEFMQLINSLMLFNS